MISVLPPNESRHERERQQETDAGYLRRRRDPDPAARDRALFTASLADDARWVVTGQVFLVAPLFPASRRSSTICTPMWHPPGRPDPDGAHRFVADGDVVVVEAKGDNVTPEGVVRYDNDYCLVFRFEDGKIRRSGNTATRSDREGARSVSANVGKGWG